jgi:hypothetical protein
MQTSRFQLGLIATLAVGLGFSLSSSEAVGYPAGAAVSMGMNPSWSTAGELSGSGEATLVTAPIGQDVMVTDLNLSTNYGTQLVDLVLGDGTLVGKYRVRSGAAGDVNRSMTTGLRVPAGETLSLQYSSGYSIFYNVTGYYAQP